MKRASAVRLVARCLPLGLLLTQLLACTLSGPREEPVIAAPTAAVAATARQPSPPVPPSMLVAAADLEPRLQARRQELLALGQGLAAADVGYYLDVQQARLRQAEFAELAVSRHGQRLQVSMPGSASFAVASAELSVAARANLDRLAAVLVEYQHSLVSVHGHTDASGPAEVNQRLSEQRALAVARYLIAAGVAAPRLLAVGHGASQPLQAETDPAAAERNRRVELRIDPLLPAGD